MSWKDQKAWEAMLDADPKLKAAWDSYLGQLEQDAAMIAQGVRPTGQAMTKAARQVLDQAMGQNAANDD
ncbi:hypothetical protein P7D22_11585 [Lichenihabitans sp. Uapishka_5]|uniref:hypothetical protein n=1 Tax=Lichenihabitans sp. Uapishka_5 TaxID=3037302 RepID=UPI0029E7D4E4|nr:hypothetical protein [Lichenihabitans sp. Uapishka_5]MDX7951811.1 hypothetical protein [Lichenihabitans sp. Uapishka_5]